MLCFCGPKQGQLDSALEALALLASPSLRPQDAKVWKEMGRLSESLNMRQEALGHYREAYGYAYPGTTP